MTILWPNTALELTADSHCDFASKSSDYLESQFGGSSAFVR
jgi:hypothetical protein